MSDWLDTIVGRGSGAVEFRLVIEGCAVEPCTSDYMRGACVAVSDTNKKRVGGLSRETLGFSENIHAPDAKLDIQIDNFTVVDPSLGPDLDAYSACFSPLPEDNVRCYLTSVLAAAGVTANVTSSANVVIGECLHLGTETVRVTAKPTGTSLTIVRGQWATTAQTHYVSATAATALQPALYTTPGAYKNRRFWLYAHGPNELGLASNGELIYRGRVGNEPTLEPDSLTWTISSGSRWSLLEVEVAARADGPLTIRGAYYPGEAPFSMQVRRSPTASIGGTTLDAVVTITLVGFYETNEAFVAALTTALNGSATIAGWGVVFTAMVSETGTWELQVRIASPARCLEIWGGSNTDGWFQYGFVEEVYGTGRVTFPPLYTVLANTNYYVAWGGSAVPIGTVDRVDAADERLIPRTNNVPAGYVRGSDTEVATHRMGRVYLTDTAGLAINDLIYHRRNEDPEDSPAAAYTVTAVDPANGWVDMYEGGDSALYPRIVCAGAHLDSLIYAKLYGASTGTDLAGFRDALVAAAPNDVNLSTGPWVLDDDLASWTAIVAEAANGRPYATRRIYWYTKGTKVDEIVSEEAKLLGLFPYLDVNFKIALRRLTIETSLITSTPVIDPATSNQVIDEDYGTQDYNADGLINVVEFSRGWEPNDAKYLDQPVQITSVDSISRLGGLRRINEVKPKAVPALGEISPAECLALAMPVLTLYGARILVMEVEVPFTFFRVLCGDIVTLNNAMLPYNGGRTINGATGLANKRAIVVGREWRFGEEPKGKLRVLMHGLRVAGYAPSAYAKTIASLGGAAWRITNDASFGFAPAGVSELSYYTIGDAIRLYAWDRAAGAAEYSGVVTSINVSGNSIDVTLAGFPGAGVNTWILGFDEAAACSLTQHQAYCAIAATPSLLITVTVGGPIIGKVWAP